MPFPPPPPPPQQQQHFRAPPPPPPPPQPGVYSNGNGSGYLQQQPQQQQQPQPQTSSFPPPPPPPPSPHSQMSSSTGTGTGQRQQQLHQQQQQQPQPQRQTTFPSMPPPPPPAGTNHQHQHQYQQYQAPPVSPVAPANAAAAAATVVPSSVAVARPPPPRTTSSLSASSAYSAPPSPFHPGSSSMRPIPSVTNAPSPPPPPPHMGPPLSATQQQYQQQQQRYAPPPTTTTTFTPIPSPHSAPVRSGIHAPPPLPAPPLATEATEAMRQPPVPLISQQQQQVQRQQQVQHLQQQQQYHAASYPPSVSQPHSYAQQQQPQQQQQLQQQRQQPYPTASYPRPTADATAATSSSSSSSLDPSQLPQPPLFTEPQQTDQTIPTYYPRAALEQHTTTSTTSNTAMHSPPPPAPNSRYHVRDDGNASPDLIRSTVYAFPAQRGIWHKTGDLPLGLTCQPLQRTSDDFVPRPRVTVHGTTEDWNDTQRIPVIYDATTTAAAGAAPPRCRSCRAYINPFCVSSYTTRTTAGETKCNLCGRVNSFAIGTSLAGWLQNATATTTTTTTTTYNTSQDWQNIGGGLPLQLGTVEYSVKGPYVTRATPVQPCFIYALDLTCRHVMEYLPLLEQLGQDLAVHVSRQQQAYQQQSSGGRSVCAAPRIGVCLVSSMGIVVRHHSRQSGSSNNNNNTNNHHQEKEHDNFHHYYTVMSDVTHDPFNPLPLSDWTFDVSQDGAVAWTHFLQHTLQRDLPYWRKLAADKNAYGLDGLEQSCGGAALAFLADALKETGGRGTWITSKRPNFGVGKLPFRQEKQQQQQAKREDVTVYTPIQLQPKSGDAEASQAFYKRLGADCAKSRVSLNVVMHTGSPGPNQFYDLATLGELCRNTCGQLIWLTSRQTWEETMYQELSRQIYSFTGWDAVFKVRCSEGVQVKSFLSSIGTVMDSEGLGGSPELELACVTPSTSISIELEHRVGGLPKDSRFVYFQTALLYTNIFGQRRLRVSTLALRTTFVVDDVFRSADFSTTMIHLMLGSHNYLRTLPTEDETASPIRKSQDALYYRCLNILVNYRQNTPAITSPTGQLILPERLQLIPLACMCLHKCPMLRPSMPRRSSGMVTMTPSGDERAYYNWYLSQTTPAMCMLLMYPNVFSIGNLDGTEDAGEWKSLAEGETLGYVHMPQPLQPSMETLRDDDIYLIDDGLRIYLYIGKLVSDDARQALSPDGSEDSNGMRGLVDRFVWQMRTYSSIQRGSESELRPTSAPVITVLQRDGHRGPGELDILNLMVSDATSGERDYFSFLSTMHRRIRDRLLADKK